MITLRSSQSYLDPFFVITLRDSMYAVTPDRSNFSRCLLPGIRIVGQCRVATAPQVSKVIAVPVPTTKRVQD